MNECYHNQDEPPHFTREQLLTIGRYLAGLAGCSAYQKHLSCQHYPKAEENHKPSRITYFKTTTSQLENQKRKPSFLIASTTDPKPAVTSLSRSYFICGTLLNTEVSSLPPTSKTSNTITLLVPN